MSFRDQYKPTEGKLLKKYGAKTIETEGAMRKMANGGSCVIKKAGGGGVMGEPDGDEPFSGDLEGDAPRHRADRAKPKGNTTVNIIVGKGGPDAQPPMPPMPPAPPPAPPMAGPPGPPPGMPPMPMRAAGGRIKKADGGKISEDSKREISRLEEENRPSALKAAGKLAAGAALGVLARKGLGRMMGSAPGGLDKTASGVLGAVGASNIDKDSDAKMVANQREIDRMKAGRAKDGMEDRARGGRMTAGADSGVGRLQKAKMHEKD